MKKILLFFVSFSASLVTLVSCQKESKGTLPEFNGVIATSEAVDLGLSVLWSSANLGAATPDQNGVFVAWGEGKEKGEYTRETYSYWNGTDYTTKDGQILERDVAFETLGKGWSIPTPAQFRELAQNTRVTRASYKGVDGWAVTSTVKNYEHKSIFFPAAGYKAEGNHVHQGIQGIYYSNQLINLDEVIPAGRLKSTKGLAQSIYFKNDELIVNFGVDGSGISTYIGCPVRPVKTK